MMKSMLNTGWLVLAGMLLAARVALGVVVVDQITGATATKTPTTAPPSFIAGALAVGMVDDFEVEGLLGLSPPLRVTVVDAVVYCSDLSMIPSIRVNIFADTGDVGPERLSGLGNHQTVEFAAPYSPANGVTVSPAPAGFPGGTLLSFDLSRGINRSGAARATGGRFFVSVVAINPPSDGAFRIATSNVAQAGSQQSAFASQLAPTNDAADLCLNGAYRVTAVSTGEGSDISCTSNVQVNLSANALPTSTVYLSDALGSGTIPPSIGIQIPPPCGPAVGQATHWRTYAITQSAAGSTTVQISLIQLPGVRMGIGSRISSVCPPAAISQCGPVFNLAAGMNVPFSCRTSEVTLNAGQTLFVMVCGDDSAAGAPYALVLRRGSISCFGVPTAPADHRVPVGATTHFFAPIVPGNTPPGSGVSPAFYSAPFPTWQRNSVPVTIDARHEVRVDPVIGTQLVIRNIQPSDAGLYFASGSGPAACPFQLGAVATLTVCVQVSQVGPTMQSVASGQPGASPFTVSVVNPPAPAPGPYPLVYQWRLNGINLLPADPRYAGVNGPALSILAADPSMAGSYTCFVAESAYDGCTNVCAGLSGAFALTVTPSCPADYNGDGTLDPDDLADFIGCFFQVPACSSADFNGDNTVDPDDLADFIGAFFSGC